jgi:CRISP-associated protein Cas1
MAQYRAHLDMTRRCELARRFVIGKLTNQRQRLQRFNRTHRDAEVSQALQQLTDLLGGLATLPVHQLPGMKPLASGDHRVEGTALETILGMEGAGSAAYFRCFGKLLSDPRQWPFPGRVKRPPTDPVNSLLSFGYSLLTNKVASAVQLVGFDHFVGYLHSSFYGRPALALDLMEEFRPGIVDSVVVNILNHRMLTPADFVVELGAIVSRMSGAKSSSRNSKSGSLKRLNIPSSGTRPAIIAVSNSRRGCWPNMSRERLMSTRHSSSGS